MSVISVGRCEAQAIRVANALQKSTPWDLQALNECLVVDIVPREFWNLVWFVTVTDERQSVVSSPLVVRAAP